MSDYPTLSEAIRAGAALRPQAFGDYIAETEDGQLCTCALGAAFEALTGELPPPSYAMKGDRDPVLDALHERFGKALITPPKVDYAGQQVLVTIAVSRLNDGKHWSREQIADWLAARGL